MSAQETYQKLVKRLNEVSTIYSCESMLGWDERTKMPPAGAEHRSNQLALLSGMAHEKFTDPVVGNWLSELEGSDLTKEPTSIEAVNIRETRHAYEKRTKLPKEFVEEWSKAITLAQGEWVKARAKNDFKAFLPWLEKNVALVKRRAELYGYDKDPYDAMLDDYETGATANEIATVFKNLREDLVKLLGKIKNAPKQPNESIIERSYPVEKQRLFGEMVAQAIGFDFSAGRLDVTTHPFCSGMGPGDTRITTRYNPNRINDALFGTMHETGHALYEMGLPKKEYYGTPMGESVSLGIHESQSRMWENQVGRSKAFWSYFFPVAQRIFREALSDVTLDEFYGAVNTVRPSYIRVEADEATYNLHILLRFELERALLNNEIKPADVAGEWNERFKKYFGIEVDKDSNGCLQDVHWSAGLMGYFPTYTLGNLHSAQFFAKALKEMPDLFKQFEQGNFAGLLDWLRKNIHSQGQRYRANDLQQKISGQQLSHKPLVDYMTKKYSEIYGF